MDRQLWCNLPVPRQEIILRNKPSPADFQVTTSGFENFLLQRFDWSEILGKGSNQRCDFSGGKQDAWQRDWIRGQEAKRP